jgi:hypothetical protein
MDEEYIEDLLQIRKMFSPSTTKSLEVGGS